MGLPGGEVVAVMADGAETVKGPGCFLRLGYANGVRTHFFGKEGLTESLDGKGFELVADGACDQLRVLDLDGRIFGFPEVDDAAGGDGYLAEDFAALIAELATVIT